MKAKLMRKIKKQKKKKQNKNIRHRKQFNFIYTIISARLNFKFYERIFFLEN